MQATFPQPKEITLRKVKNLLEQKEVYGTFYTNNFFFRRYLARYMNKLDKATINGNTIEIPFDIRVEEAGLFELEQSFYWMVQTNTGDFPGKTEEQIADILAGNTMPDMISASVSLASMETVVRFEEPHIELQSFKLNGHQLDLVHFTKFVEVTSEDGETDIFEQYVTLLFGEPGKLSPFSFMVSDKELSKSDSAKLLALLAGDNITGQAITAIREVGNKDSKMVRATYPVNRLIGLNYNQKSEFVFQGEANMIVLPRESIKGVQVVPDEEGSYHIVIRTDQDTKLILYME